MKQVGAIKFLIMAGILAGGATWGEFASNMVFVWLGNLVGGGGILAGMYFLAFKVGMGETKKKPIDQLTDKMIKEK